MISELLAIDPGPDHSAFMVLTDGSPSAFLKCPNCDLLSLLRESKSTSPAYIEKIASYGMAVGAEVFDTCVWSGRFYEAMESRGRQVRMVPRLAIKTHLCHSAKANDSTIRQALIDRYGPGKDRAIGKKAAPGPLFGVKADIWAALALAVTAWDARL